MATVQIAKEVLDALKPQVGMLNLPEDQLAGKTFTLIEVLKPEDNQGVNLETKSKDNNRIGFRFENEDKKTARISVRSLLYTETVADETKPNETEPLIEVLSEKMAAGGTDRVELPNSFKVIEVKTRTMEENPNRVVYPSYMYKEFDEKRKSLKAMGKTREQINEEIYGNFDFIAGLPLGELTDRWKKRNPEPLKVIKIKIIS